MKIKAPIGNYYGTPYVVCKEGRYYIGLKNWDGEQERPISEEFYKAWVKEFEKK